MTSSHNKCIYVRSREREKSERPQMVEFDGEASKIAAVIVFVAIPAASLLRHYADPLRSAILGRPVRICREEVKSEDGIDLDCVICLGKVAAGERLRALPCNHRFHGDCIDEWLRARSTCPLCRCQVASLYSDGSRPGSSLIEKIWEWIDPIGSELTMDLYGTTNYLS